LLTATEIAKIAHLSMKKPRTQPNKWKKDRLIFAINHKGIDYFPTYGLDQDKNYRPIEAMADVLNVFAGSKDGWGLAFWFASVNSFLGGKRPKDLLAKAPHKVIAAALDELVDVTHG